MVVNARLRQQTADAARRASFERNLSDNRNVVVAIEGSDPALKDQWVILGAHFDSRTRRWLMAAFSTARCS